jgi:cell division protein FtsQ
MSLSAHLPPPARTWRDIQQDIAPRAMSGEGRKRLAFATLKTIAITAIACAALWGGYELLRLWQDDPMRLKAPVKSSPLRTIALQSDGTLDEAWVTQNLALPRDIDLMELDLYALRERLLAHPQVRTAVLARKFPDTLSVVLEERMPVARVRVPVGDGRTADYLVARDGVVFSGVNFAADRLDSLPHLDGLKLRLAAGGFAPIAGMETVSDLLVAARVNTFDLYARWRIVSLARLASDGVITVRATDIGEITFGTRDDFLKQLAQLDLIVDRSRGRPDGKTIASVNLAVGLSANGILVPVIYAEPPAPGLDLAAEAANPISPAAPVAPSPGAARTSEVSSPLFQSPRNTRPQNQTTPAPPPERAAPRRPSAFFPPPSPTAL